MIKQAERVHLKKVSIPRVPVMVYVGRGLQWLKSALLKFGALIFN